MIYLLGKGPSLASWTTQFYSGQVVYAINDAIYATNSSQDATMVRCDKGEFKFCQKIPKWAKAALWEGLKPFNLYGDREVEYFSHQGLHLPKRLCTLWMAVALIHQRHPNEPVSMYGFDALVQDKVALPYKYDAYHPDYENDRNREGTFQDQRPSGRRVPKHMVAQFTVMPWGIPLKECIIYG